MNASEYARAQGAPIDAWAKSSTGGYGAHRNIMAPPKFANYLQADLLVSIHNNGGGGCGTETLYDRTNGYGGESARLANLIQTKLIAELRANWNPGWCNPGVKGFNGAYGENRVFNGPAVIVELAFMDNESDNTALKDSRFREIATAAIRDAITEYASGSVAPPAVVQTFQGNPNSRLFFDQNGERINLEVCADNLPGQIVSTRLVRPDRIWMSCRCGQLVDA